MPNTLSPAEMNRILDALNHTSDQGRDSDISERKREERDFHDNHRGAHADEEAFLKANSNLKYYKVTSKSLRYLENWLSENCPGKICLDVACGNGDTAIRMAHAGAALSIGIDISPISVENARARARAEGLSAERVRFFVMDAENPSLPPGSVDVVTCFGVLHHMDLSYVFPELRRLLVPAGKILACEALNQNPLIRLYRRLTPQMRTRWEARHILGPAELKFASRFFELGEVRYWNLATIFGRFVPRMLPALEVADAVLMRIPGLRRMAWMFTFEMTNNGHQL